MKLSKRKARLKELLRRMKAGHDVAQRDLKLALTADEYALMQERWQEQKVFRQEEKPDAVKKYEQLLKKVKFLESKSEWYSGHHIRRRKRDKNGERFAQRFGWEAEAVLEAAMEYFEEIICKDQYLMRWFDRDVARYSDGSPNLLDSDVGISPENVPHVITSRSPHKLQGKMIGVMSKRELKQDALASALADIRTEEKQRKRGMTREQEEAAQKERMDKLLERVRQRSSI